MTFKPFQSVPACLAVMVILVACLLQFLRPSLFERFENTSYDFRVRQALRFVPAVAPNFGFIYMDEKTVRAIHDGSLGYRFGLYWPRQIYGYALHELAAQQARCVALDVIFGELRPDHPGVVLSDNDIVDSDDFFAQELGRSPAILAVTREVTPPALFLTNAIPGDITTEKDADGILRRVKAFRDYGLEWHPAFRQVEADRGFGIDLSRARVEPRRVVLPRSGAEDIVVPLDENGDFDLADFGGENLPPGVPRKAKPLTARRAWHMGIVMAAMELGLDLDKARVELERGRIVLPGPGGLERTLPVDSRGYFYIDWSIPHNHPGLYRQSLEDLLADYRQRLATGVGKAPPPWKGKLVLVGSAAVMGNDLTDRGATPLEGDTLLVSKHWNVANSVLTGRFVRRTPWPMDVALVAAVGALAALLAARLRVAAASAAVALLAVGYAAAALAWYVVYRVWIPVVWPLAGVALVYAALVSWRVLFEQAEQRRVRSIFSTVVSPKIVSELLQAKSLDLPGARREVTVLFADVRGFTEFTDTSQESVGEYVRRQGLTGPAAEACYDEQARHTLSTINLYLGLVADTTIRNDGTLDKYIGDCVMAFWGAPTPNPAHALACVRSAIETQRAIHQLNGERRAENERIAAENAQRAAQGLPALPLLPILELGTGINTGTVTVGLMGSEAKTRNYTVFGRDVNLASRLESLSGRSRILVSQATYDHLRRDDPALAATCRQLEPVQVKGIRSAMVVYEVPWQVPSLSPEGDKGGVPAEPASASRGQPGPGLRASA